ncbi:MAG: DUF3800 domain-containing protein [Nanoarchaeota archaeon]|nr:DUF3800 domain-containing protein [Nanoarchaeota archaeon]MBU4086622.1 DUF3800 domain-containing protein [Nanoarchaeota archaeon]
MSYLYIDESGDLGFSKKGSEYFIITCVKIDDEKTNLDFNRIPKRVRQRIFSKKHKGLSELKFSNSNDEIRLDFLKRASKLNIEIYTLIIKKELAYEELKNNLPTLYNYLIKIILESPLKRLKNNLHLEICLDRCMSSSQRENFQNYIKTEFLSIFQKLPKVDISHECSGQNNSLQVIDFICGAFGYKYNTSKLSEGSDRYVKVIKDKIIIEKDDLFKNK